MLNITGKKPRELFMIGNLHLKVHISCSRFLSNLSIAFLWMYGKIKGKLCSSCEMLAWNQMWFMPLLLSLGETAQHFPINAKVIHALWNAAVKIIICLWDRPNNSPPIRIKQSQLFNQKREKDTLSLPLNYRAFNMLLYHYPFPSPSITTEFFQ